MNAPVNNNNEEADTVGALPDNKRASRGTGRRRSTLMKGFVNTLGNNAIRNLLDEPIFDKVGWIKAGKSFGELALRTTKPRAARIVWNSPWEFAVMCKADYDKILLKIEERLVNDIVEFFQSIPLFSAWSK